MTSDLIWPRRSRSLFQCQLSCNILTAVSVGDQGHGFIMTDPNIYSVQDHIHKWIPPSMAPNVAQRRESSPSGPLFITSRSGHYHIHLIHVDLRQGIPSISTAACMYKMMYARQQEYLLNQRRRQLMTSPAVYCWQPPPRSRQPRPLLDKQCPLLARRHCLQPARPMASPASPRTSPRPCSPAEKQDPLGRPLGINTHCTL